MNNEEIDKRLKEIDEIMRPMFLEMLSLRVEKSLNNGKTFMKFLEGKTFILKLNNERTDVYLYNNQFSPSELFKHGADDDYHTSLNPQTEIRIYIDDGDITISSDNPKALFEFAKEKSLVIVSDELESTINHLENFALELRKLMK